MPTADRTVTQEVVDYIQGMSLDAIPAGVRKELRRCLADGLGVMLAGVPAGCSRVVQQYVREQEAPARATILGTASQTSSSLAALANGVAGHAEDYDDTQLSTTPDRVYGLLTHPTVPVLASSLAVAEETGASGAAFLTAMGTGIEVACKVAEAISPTHYMQGFHTTGTVGVFGAVAAAAQLRGLNAEQTRFALGIAASKGAGLRANFGTMTKPYHSGAAAENGVVAARLAGLGYQADPNALDGPWGFFQVTGGGAEPERVLGRLGTPYTLEWPGVSVKPYPCGSLAHPTMDALLDLLTSHDVAPEEVEEVRLGAGKNILQPLRYQEPQSGLEGKFSLPFCLAILVLRRRAGVAEFTDDVVRSPEVRSMMARVHPYHSLEVEALGTDRIRSVLDVRLKDGRTLHCEASTSRGTPERPMSWAEIEEKFQDCAQGVLPAAQGASALELIARVEELPDVTPLVAALVARG